VLNLFQVYRVVVLPLANTWMAGSLLHKMGMRPGRGVVGALGAGAAGCIVVGAKVGVGRACMHAFMSAAWHTLGRSMWCCQAMRSPLHGGVHVLMAAHPF
jgi:hypothetical protein